MIVGGKKRRIFVRRALIDAPGARNTVQLRVSPNYLLLHCSLSILLQWEESQHTCSAVLSHSPRIVGAGVGAGVESVTGGGVAGGGVAGLGVAGKTVRTRERQTHGGIQLMGWEK